MFLVEVNMAGDEHAAGGAVEAPVALVLRRVAEEYAGNRARRKLVGGSGAGVRVAEASEDADATVIGRGAVQKLKRSKVLANTARATIVKEGGRGESFGPERGRHGRLGEQGTNSLV